jgi:hypothetical protein
MASAPTDNAVLLPISPNRRLALSLLQQTHPQQLTLDLSPPPLPIPEPIRPQVRELLALLLQQVAGRDAGDPVQRLGGEHGR